jgi:hypothetical protein
MWAKGFRVFNTQCADMPCADINACSRAATVKGNTCAAGGSQLQLASAWRQLQVSC